jgi:hypothetical protein
VQHYCHTGFDIFLKDLHLRKFLDRPNHVTNICLGSIMEQPGEANKGVFAAGLQML